MNRKSTSYGQLVVGVLFGVVCGGVWLIKGRILGGLWIWSLVALFLGYALARSFSARLLVVTIVAVIYGGALAYFAAASEISGKGIYYHDMFSRLPRAEPVTRESSPVKFRTATNYKWAGSAVCFGIAAVTFWGRRRAGAVELAEG